MYRTEPIARLSPTFALYRDILVGVALVLTFSIRFSIQAFEFGDDRLALLAVSSDAGSPIEQAITLLVFFNSVFLARLSRLPPRMLIFSMAPLAPLLLLALASFLWSDFPWLTVRRTSRLVIEVTAWTLLALTYVNEGNRLMRLLFRLFAVITAANLASLAAPSISFDPLGFHGIHLHKLDAGRFLFFAIPVFVIGIINPIISKSRAAATVLFTVAALLMPLTNSKTAFVCVPLGIFMTVGLRLLMGGDARVRGGLFLVYLFGALGICIVVGDFGLDTVFDRVFGDVTLTGRDNIWHFALDRFVQRPILGVGFGALWQTGAGVIQSLIAYDAYSFINQAHNGYIDILAHLGLAGFIGLVAFLVIVFIRLCTAISRYEVGKGVGVASYGLYLLLGSAVYNFTDSTYLFSGRSMWIMLVFVSTCATARLVNDRARLPVYRTMRHMKLMRSRQGS